MTEPGIKITLPRSVTALPQRDTAVTVFIGADRSLHLDGEPVAAEALGAALAARLDGADERKVIIKADELVDLALAVMVMDMAKEAGADGLVVSTRAREADE